MKTEQEILTTEIIKKYMEWFNLTKEEAQSLAISNPEYFAGTYMIISVVAKIILETIKLI